MKRVILIIGTLISFNLAVKAQIPLSGFIKTIGASDTYSTHLDSLGAGGYHTTFSIATRDAIPTQRRKVGMMVRVSSIDSTYVLSGGITNSNWVTFSAGGGITPAILSDSLSAYEKVQDGLISGGGATTNGDSLIVALGVARINSINYSFTGRTFADIAPSATGLTRILIVYANTLGLLDSIAGAQSNNPVDPNLPANTVRVVTVSVSDAGLGTPTVDLSGKANLVGGNEFTGLQKFGNQLSINSSAIGGGIGFNRDISTGAIYDSLRTPFQIQNFQDTLEVQIYDSLSVLNKSHKFFKTGNVYFDGSVNIPLGSSYLVNGVPLSTNPDSTVFRTVANSYSLATGQPRLTNPITGTGTINLLPKFTGSTTLGNSLIFDNGTNVGIKNTSPSRPLTVDAGSDYLTSFFKGGLLSGGNYFSSILVGYQDALTNQSAQFGYVYNPTTPTLSFAHITPFGSTEGSLFKVQANGNVGIGTATPDFKVDVVGGAIQVPSVAFGAIGGYYFNSGGNVSARRWLLSNDVNAFGDFVISTSTTQTGSPTTQRFVIDSIGNVGIGTTSPTLAKLQVEGTGFFNSSLTANSFIKTGGTSSQFLKADGSVDGNTYLTSVTPAFGFTSTTPITTSGTLTVDSTQVRTVANSYSLASGQPRLVSGTNIKTVNSTSLLGSGDLNVGTITSVGATVPSFLSVSGSPITSSGSLDISYSGTALPVDNGGTGATSSNAAITNLTGFTTTVTAAGTTVLTDTSTLYQVFTGSTTQTVRLPVTSTLELGWTFRICNNSTGVLFVQSSGGNAVMTVVPGTTARLICIGQGLTTAANWEFGFSDFSTLTGTGNVALTNSPTFTGTLNAAAITANTGVSFVTSTQPIEIGINQSTGATTIGGTGTTSTLTLGRSTVSNTTNIQAGATTSGNTKTINFGTEGLLGSTTNINIGSNTSNTSIGLLGKVGIGVIPSSSTNLVLPASTTTVSSLRIPNGVAPTTPVSGDVWSLTTGLRTQIFDGTNTKDFIFDKANLLLAGTGVRAVTSNAIGDIASTTPIIEQFTTDGDVILAIVTATYSGNRASIAPAGGKIFYKGQFYDDGTHTYLAIADNSVKRF
jgi:hypothetical protein